jgi:hypothetical protein
MARDPAAKSRLFSELESLIAAHQYAGVDIDWEPSARNDADKATFTEFMQSLRARFPGYVITTALGTGEYNARHIDWQKIAASVDYINLMTYVYAGQWSGHSAHNASLYRPTSYADPDGLDVATSVRDVIEKYGVLPEKLLLGLPFFGLQFSTDRMGEPFTASARHYGQEVAYADVAWRAESGAYRVLWDEGGRVPYLERTSGGHTLSFDDERSIAEKCRYAREQSLSGVLIWHVGADIVRGRPVLQNSMARAFGITPRGPDPRLREAFFELRLREGRDLEQRIAVLHAELLRLHPGLSDELGPVPTLDRAGQSHGDLDKRLRNLDERLIGLETTYDRLNQKLAALPIELRRGRLVENPGPTLLLSDFDKGSLQHALGGLWQAEVDHNGLGTVLHPSPLAVTPGGARSRNALKVWGHYGKNQAPWPHASVAARFGKVDLSAFRGLRFFAKGDGKTYSVLLERESVRDYAHFRFDFIAGPVWSEIRIRFADFGQPDWGARVEPAWFDVTGLTFSPSSRLDDEDFELWLDSVELLRELR